MAPTLDNVKTNTRPPSRTDTHGAGMGSTARAVSARVRGGYIVRLKIKAELTFGSARVSSRQTTARDIIKVFDFQSCVKNKQGANT